MAPWATPPVRIAVRAPIVPLEQSRLLSARLDFTAQLPAACLMLYLVYALPDRPAQAEDRPRRLHAQQARLVRRRAPQVCSEIV